VESGAGSAREDDAFSIQGMCYVWDLE
jgi:hypothetical protein